MIKQGCENEEKSAQKSMKKLITEAGVILFDMGGSKLHDRVAGRAGVVEGGRGGVLSKLLFIKDRSIKYINGLGM